MSDYVLKIGEQEFRAEVREITPDEARVVVNGTEYAVALLEVARRPQPPRAAPSAPAPAARPTAAPAAAPTPSPRPVTAGDSGVVRAPLPGLILEIKAQEGQAVQAGDPIVVMEAMKMENVVSAPHTGTVRKVFVGAGDSVGEQDPLVEISRPEMTTL